MSAPHEATTGCLVVHEGPDVGRYFALETSPSGAPTLSVGRSTQCAIVLHDQRASRHHADLHWNGSVWEILDRASTNGTNVNGIRILGPQPLSPGDRISIGETTLVLRTGSSAGAPAMHPRPPAGRGGPLSPPGRGGSGTAPDQEGWRYAAASTSPAFWLTLIVVAAAAVALAAGSFLPWLRVTGSLSEDLNPTLESLAGVVSSFLGQESLLNISQEISGLEGFGKLTLGIALLCIAALAADATQVSVRASALPGIAYLLLGLIATGAMASDLLNVYQLYRKVESLGLLFGIQLGEVVQFIDRFVDMEVTPLPGLLLTTIGLALLLSGGIGRLLVALLRRRPNA